MQVVELNSGTPACETLLYHQSCSRKLGGTALRTGYKARLPVHRGRADEITRNDSTGWDVGSNGTGAAQKHFFFSHIDSECVHTRVTVENKALTYNAFSHPLKGQRSMDIEKHYLLW